jgi:hypothetical protein
MTNVIEIAKSAVETGGSDHSRQWFLKRIDEAVERRRQPGQSFHQSYSQFISEDHVGKLLFAASKVARHDDFGRDTIAKSDDIPDTVSMRLAKCVAALMASAPHLSQDEAIEIVVKRNPEAAAVARREIANSSPSSFQKAATGATDSPCAQRLKDLAQSMARTSNLDLNQAFQAVCDANPILAAQARKEIDARRQAEGLPVEGEPDQDDTSMSKRMHHEQRVAFTKDDVPMGNGGLIRVSKEAGASDARNRIIAIAQRLFETGNARDMVQAVQIALQRNPLLSDMIPSGMQSLIPTESPISPADTMNSNSRLFCSVAGRDNRAPSLVGMTAAFIGSWRGAPSASWFDGQNAEAGGRRWMA